jgi:hypothetical protein
MSSGRQPKCPELKSFTPKGIIQPATSVCNPDVQNPPEIPTPAVGCAEANGLLPQDAGPGQAGKAALFSPRTLYRFGTCKDKASQVRGMALVNGLGTWPRIGAVD